MEVTPEIYAWLAELKILNSEKTIIMKKEGLILIDDSITNKILNGFHIDKILYYLENLYNKFYKIKLFYTQKLEEIKTHQQNIKNTIIDKTTRYFIWKIIKEVIENFGIEMEEDKINLLSNGDVETLKNLLKTIYFLSSELMKRSIDSSENNKNKTEKQEKNNNVNYSTLLKNKSGGANNFNEKNKSLSNETNHKTHSSENSQIINNQNLFDTSDVLKKLNVSNLRENNAKLNIQIKKSSDALDLNDLDPNKNLNESESPLEFFILTLSQSLDMKPRQAAALLSNNRKYLIQIANRGIKGDFSKIQKWYQKVIHNYSILIKIIKFSQMKDLKAMVYATLSVGLYSKNYQVAQHTYDLLIQLEGDLSSDYDWLIKEGLESFIFCINKHKVLRIGLMNFIYKISTSHIDQTNMEFFNTKKFTNTKIYEFISNIIDILKLVGHDAFTYFRKTIPEFCLKETTEISTAISILADCWIKLDYLSPHDSVIINSIIKLYKNSLRVKGQKVIQLAVISQLFRILKYLGDSKDSHAPEIYKTLVFHFLENYDDKYLREIFLNNFIFIFINEITIPIDILLTPYLRQLKNSNNFEIIDFNFIYQIIDHPRISSENIKDIFNFSSYVSLSNMFYSRSANTIINLILEKYLNIINKNNLLSTPNNSLKEILDEIVKYIQSALKIYLQNPKDYMILESSYDILNFNFEYINKKIEKDIIETVENYKKEKNLYSMGLLSLLWYFDSHDDVMMRLEEKYTEKHDNYFNNIKIKKDKQVRILPKNCKPEEVLKIIKEKRERDIKIKEEKIIQKISNEKKIQLNLLKKVLDKSADIGKSVLDTNINNTLINNDYSSINNNLSTTNNDNKNILNSELINNSILPSKQGFADISRINNISFNNNLKNNPIGSLKNLPYYINLEECEEREIIAIEGLFREFHKNIKRFFFNFSKDVNNLLPRPNLLKMLRELGIENSIITLDELSKIIRLTIGAPLNAFNKSQFDKLIIQISSLVFSKIKPYIPLSKSLNEFFLIIEKWDNTNKLNTSSISLNPLKINNQSQKNIKKIYENKVLKYLKKKIENVFLSEEDMIYIFSPKDAAISSKSENFLDINLEESSYYKKNNQKINNSTKNQTIKEDSNYFHKDILLPPGYKKVFTTKVDYQYSLNKDFVLNFLPESKIISYEILDEIINKKFNINFIEPYVKVYNSYKVVEEPIDPKKKWCDKISITYSKMDKSMEYIGKEVGDLLEEMLRAVDKGWNNLEKPKFIPPKEKVELEEQQKKIKENLEKEKKRKERKKEIEINLKKLNEEKEKENKIKEEENKKFREYKDKEIFSLLIKEKELKEKIKNDFKIAKLEKEKLEENKKKMENLKIEESKKKKEIEKIEFFKTQKRKLKEQFKEIRSEKNNFIKQQQEILNLKLPEVNIKKILDKDKEYIEFEKNLNDIIEDLLRRNDIKEFLLEYENHFKIIYDIYSRLGNYKITFFTEQAIHFNEFKEFCVNFTIFGLLINTDQMNYIFRKVCKRNEGTSDDIFFLRFPDFMICLIYICVFLKITNRSNRRILPTDLEKIDLISIKALVDFIGLRLPFNKKEVEDFINDRRALSAKQLFKLQTQIKKERTDIVKPSSANRSRSSLIGNNKNKSLEKIKIREKKVEEKK